MAVGRRTHHHMGFHIDIFMALFAKLGNLFRKE
jgi:hypothetical protein